MNVDHILGPHDTLPMNAFEPSMFAPTVREMLGIMTDSELAQALGVTTTTLGAWRGKDYGPKSIALGKAIFYRIPDVKQWVLEQP